MRRLRVGIDCDGVLADFKLAYTTEMQRLFPDVPNLIHNTSGMLGWKEELHPGVTYQMVKETWKKVGESRDWWLTLAPIPSFEERKALTHLARWNDVYIITARAETAGESVPFQTYRWLGNNGIYGASVIVTQKKGPMAKALGLDFFIDDKPENCEEVNEDTDGCRVYLREWDWNSKFCTNWAIGTMKSLGSFIERVWLERGDKHHE